MRTKFRIAALYASFSSSLAWFPVGSKRSEQWVGCIRGGDVTKNGSDASISSEGSNENGRNLAFLNDTSGDDVSLEQDQNISDMGEGSQTFLDGYDNMSDSLIANDGTSGVNASSTEEDSQQEDKQIRNMNIAESNINEDDINGNDDVLEHDIHYSNESQGDEEMLITGNTAESDFNEDISSLEDGVDDDIVGADLYYSEEFHEDEQTLITEDVVESDFTGDSFDYDVLKDDIHYSDESQEDEEISIAEDAVDSSCNEDDIDDDVLEAGIQYTEESQEDEQMTITEDDVEDDFNEDNIDDDMQYTDEDSQEDEQIPITEDESESHFDDDVLDAGIQYTEESQEDEQMVVTEDDVESDFNEDDIDDNMQYSEEGSQEEEIHIREDESESNFNEHDVDDDVLEAGIQYTEEDSQEDEEIPITEDDVDDDFNEDDVLEDDMQYTEEHSQEDEQIPITEDEAESDFNEDDIHDDVLKHSIQYVEEESKEEEEIPVTESEAEHDLEADMYVIENDVNDGMLGAGFQYTEEESKEGEQMSIIQDAKESDINADAHVVEDSINNDILVADAQHADRELQEDQQKSILQDEAEGNFILNDDVVEDSVKNNSRVANEGIMQENIDDIQTAVSGIDEGGEGATPLENDTFDVEENFYRIEEDMYSEDGNDMDIDISNEIRSVGSENEGDHTIDSEEETAGFDSNEIISFLQSKDSDEEEDEQIRPVLISLTQEEEEAIQAQEEAFPDVQTDFIVDENFERSSIEDSRIPEKTNHEIPYEADIKIDNDVDVPDHLNSANDRIADKSSTNINDAHNEDILVEVDQVVPDSNDRELENNCMDDIPAGNSAITNSMSAEDNGEVGDSKFYDHDNLSRDVLEEIGAQNQVHQDKKSEDAEDLYQLRSLEPHDSFDSDKYQNSMSEIEVPNDHDQPLILQDETNRSNDVDFSDTTTDVSGMSDYDIIFDSDMHAENVEFGAAGGMEMTDFDPTGSDSAAFVDRMDLADAYDDRETEGSDIEKTSPRKAEVTRRTDEILEEAKVKEDIKANAASQDENNRNHNILCDELGYRSIDVKKMKPHVASVLVRQRFKKPKKGLSPDYFIEDDVLIQSRSVSQVRWKLASFQNRDPQNIIKKDLRRLGYSVAEVKAMKPDVAEVLTKKSFKRPKHGLSSECFLKDNKLSLEDKKQTWGVHMRNLFLSISAIAVLPLYFQSSIRSCSSDSSPIITNEDIAQNMEVSLNETSST